MKRHTLIFIFLLLCGFAFVVPLPNSWVPVLGDDNCFSDFVRVDPNFMPAFYSHPLGSPWANMRELYKNSKKA